MQRGLKATKSFSFLIILPGSHLQKGPSPKIKTFFFSLIFVFVSLVIPSLCFFCISKDKALFFLGRVFVAWKIFPSHFFHAKIEVVLLRIYEKIYSCAIIPPRKISFFFIHLLFFIPPLPLVCK